MTKVAALYVDPKGCYAGLDGVEVWDDARDARLYDGPWPVVAHPPCSRWCRLAGLVEARYGYRRGDDGGTFAAGLKSVRRWGGVLEHPAYTDAWAHFWIPRPHRGGGWQRTMCGGWTCHVEQWHYGHAAAKATWLYYVGDTPPPDLVWGFTPDNELTAYVTDGRGDAMRRGRPERRALVSWCGNKVSPAMEGRRRLGKREASATPPAFRDMLLSLARLSVTVGGTRA